MSCCIGASKPTYIVTFAENFNCIVCFIVAFVCLLHELCALQLGVACGDGLSETPKNSIAPITMGPDCFTMVFSPPTSAYVLLVPNHWSNDGMVSFYRYGLEVVHYNIKSSCQSQRDRGTRLHFDVCFLS